MEKLCWIFYIRQMFKKKYHMVKFLFLETYSIVEMVNYVVQTIFFSSFYFIITNYSSILSCMHVAHTNDDAQYYVLPSEEYRFWNSFILLFTWNGNGCLPIENRVINRPLQHFYWRRLAFVHLIVEIRLVWSCSVHFFSHFLCTFYNP